MFGEAWDRKMQVDLKQRLKSQQPTWGQTWSFGPNPVYVFIMELTVPLEEAINKAFERKRLWFANLEAEAEARGRNVFAQPVEVQGLCS